MNESPVTLLGGGASIGACTVLGSVMILPSVGVARALGLALAAWARASVEHAPAATPRAQIQA
jgi:hypothetical protein